MGRKECTFLCCNLEVVITLWEHVIWSSSGRKRECFTKLFFSWAVKGEKEEVDWQGNEYDIVYPKRRNSKESSLLLNPYMNLVFSASISTWVVMVDILIITTTLRNWSNLDCVSSDEFILEINWNSHLIFIFNIIYYVRELNFKIN